MQTNFILEMEIFWDKISRNKIYFFFNFLGLCFFFLLGFSFSLRPSCCAFGFFFPDSMSRSRRAGGRHKAAASRVAPAGAQVQSHGRLVRELARIDPDAFTARPPHDWSPNQLVLAIRDRRDRHGCEGRVHLQHRELRDCTHNTHGHVDPTGLWHVPSAHYTHDDTHAAVMPSQLLPPPPPPMPLISHELSSALTKLLSHVPKPEAGPAQETLLQPAGVVAVKHLCSTGSRVVCVDGTPNATRGLLGWDAHTHAPLDTHVSNIHTIVPAAYFTGSAHSADAGLFVVTRDARVVHLADNGHTTRQMSVQLRFTHPTDKPEPTPLAYQPCHRALAYADKTHIYVAVASGALPVAVTHDEAGHVPSVMEWSPSGALLTAVFPRIIKVYAWANKRLELWCELAPFSAAPTAVTYNKMRAAAWCDDAHVAVVTSTQLYMFNIASQHQPLLVHNAVLRNMGAALAVGQRTVGSVTVAVGTRGGVEVHEMTWYGAAGGACAAAAAAVAAHDVGGCASGVAWVAGTNQWAVAVDNGRIVLMLRT